MNTREPDNAINPEVLAGRLPRDVQPDRDLWMGIEARLDAEPEAPVGKARAGRLPTVWLQAAAAVVVVLTASIFGVVWMTDSGTPVEIAATSPVPGEAPDTPQVPVWPGSMADDPAVYAIEALPVEVREEVKISLAELRAARKAVEDVLEQQPNNAWLRSLWMHTYEQEMKLLEDVAWATNSLEKRMKT